MAVDLMTMKYSSSSSSSVREQQTAMQEAATAGLRSMEHLLLNLSSPSAKPYNYSSAAEIDCREITEFTVNKFKKVISLLDRTGHARFRHGPLKTQTPHHNPNPPPPPPQPPSNSSKLSPPPVLTFDFTKPMPSTSSPPTLPKKQQQPSPSMENNTSVHSGSSTFSISPPPSNSGNSSSCCFLPQSSLTADPTVSNGKIFGPNSILSKPPLPQQQQPTSMNGCNNKNHHRVGSSSSTSSAHCHCSKRKKSRMKKTTIRVPAISPKIADIPSDEYSWRKYGQKPIKGSPYPRGYYKCSTVRGCPAKKHVERALDDPTMLIVTYESEHSHNIINSNTSTITTNNNSTVCSSNSTMVMAPHASPVVATIGPSSSSTPQAAGMPVATIVFESSR